MRKRPVAESCGERSATGVKFVRDHEHGMYATLAE
jgi:hypothetical protein